MKRFLFLLTFMCLVLAASAQQKRFRLYGMLQHSGSVPSKECPKDKWGKQCAKVELTIPFGGVKVTGDNIVGDVTYKNGVYSFYHSTRKKKIYVSAEGFKTFEMTLDGMKMREGYTAKLIVPEDKNAGKAYVTFESDEVDDYMVIINGNEYKSNGEGQVVTNLPYGTYEYVVRAKDREESKGKFVLTGKPVTENVKLDLVKANVGIMVDDIASCSVDNVVTTDRDVKLPIGAHTFLATINDSVYYRQIMVPREGTTVDVKMLGSIRVSSKDGAKVVVSPVGKTVMPEGKEIQANAERLEALHTNQGAALIGTDKSIDNVLGTYNIYAYRRGYLPNYKQIQVPVRQQVDVDLPLKRDIVSVGYISYDASIDQPIGLRAGFCSRFGMYVGFRVSVLNMQEWWYDEKKTDYKPTNKSYLLHNKEKVDDIPANAKDKGPWRYQITGGLMFNVNRWLFLYAGGGYGENKDIYEVTEDSNPKYVFDKRYKCGVGEGGVILRFGALALTGGVSAMIGDGKTWIEPNVGLGVIIGKKNHNSPFEY